MKLEMISLIIPVYNEAQVIKKVISGYNDFFKKNVDYDHEIIAVNDASIDNSREIIEDICRETKNVKIISNDQNRGKGYSVRRGIDAAQGDIIIFVDGDTTFFPEDIPRFIEQINAGFDVVIASRRKKETNFILGIKSFPYIFYRHIQGIIFNLFVRAITGLNIYDTQCGFKAFKSQLAKNISEKCNVDKFSFDIEMLMHAKLMQAKIVEIPITLKYIDEKDSSVTFSQTLKALVDTFKLRKIFKDY